MTFQGRKDTFISMSSTVYGNIKKMDLYGNKFVDETKQNSLIKKKYFLNNESIFFILNVGEKYGYGH